MMGIAALRTAADAPSILQPMPIPPEFLSVVPQMTLDDFRLQIVR
jgi:hypothetical protein